MRCAILRLVSVGDPAVGPRAVRDSEAIQATTLRRAWDHPLSLTASLQDKRAKGGPSLSHKRSRVMDSTKTSATEGEAEERSNDETEKSQASAKPDTPLVTQTSAGRRQAAGEEAEEGSASR